MEQSIVFFVHSFIRCISVWVGSTWFDPLSRLGGVLWGRLLPPSLPSPLPCPGRGTRDLKGLSTEAPPPLDLEAATMGWWKPSLLLTPVSSPSLYQYGLPACMHHSASASVQLSELLLAHSQPEIRAAVAHQRWWWCVVLQNALWMIRRLRANPVKWRWSASSPVCLLLLALISKAHPFT